MFIHFKCGLNKSYFDEGVENVVIGNYIRISSLGKKVRPMGSAVSDHLLFCDQSQSSDSFSVLTKENRKFVLELKESLLTMRDKPSFNRNIGSAPLYLFKQSLI